MTTLSIIRIEFAELAPALECQNALAVAFNVVYTILVVTLLELSLYMYCLCYYTSLLIFAEMSIPIEIQKLSIKKIKL